jgi:hypothetical protein
VKEVPINGIFNNQIKKSIKFLEACRKYHEVSLSSDVSDEISGTQQTKIIAD